MTKLWLTKWGFFFFGLGLNLYGWSALWFRVWNLGFGILGLGFRVWNLGFGILGLGFRVWNLGFGIVWVFGVWKFRVLGSWWQISKNQIGSNRNAIFRKGSLRVYFSGKRLALAGLAWPGLAWPGLGLAWLGLAWPAHALPLAFPCPLRIHICCNFDPTLQNQKNQGKSSLGFRVYFSALFL